jgi:hypothetical protein
MMSSVNPTPADTEVPKGIVGTRVIMVWAMVFMGIVIYAMFWFLFGNTALAMINAMETQFTYLSEPPFSDVVGWLLVVIEYHPIIAIFGWLLWGFLNSARRDVRTWEV